MNKTDLSTNITQKQLLEFKEEYIKKIEIIKNPENLYIYPDLDKLVDSQKTSSKMETNLSKRVEMCIKIAKSPLIIVTFILVTLIIHMMIQKYDICTYDLFETFYKFHLFSILFLLIIGTIFYVQFK